MSKYVKKSLHEYPFICTWYGQSSLSMNTTTLYPQEAEFDVYAKYVSDVTRPECAETLAEVVSRPDVSDALTSAGHGFKEAVKYYLPKLLLVPVYHVFTYFKDIEVCCGQLCEERLTLQHLYYLFLVIVEVSREREVSVMAGCVRRDLAIVFI